MESDPDSRRGETSTSYKSLQELRAVTASFGDREVSRFLNACIRGAGVGLCLRGGLHLLSWLMALFSKSRRHRLTLDPFRSILEQFVDTIRYTLFLGSLSGIYVGVDEGIANAFGRERTKRWRSFLAGLLSGPSILLTGAKQRHHSLALYILVRGVTLLVRCGNKPQSPPMLRRLLAPSRWQHGDTALMCAATSQLGYSWIVLPKTLPPSYVHFLNHHGGKQPHHYAATRELAVNNRNCVPPSRLLSLRHSRHEDFCGRLPCDFLHPGRGCVTNLFAFLPGAYLRALPVYAPVYIVPAMLVHRHKLLKAGAEQIWAKVGKGIARSSAFLAAYCAMAWGGACTGFALTGNCTPAGIYLSCWTGGLATLIEKKSRRMELALYCISRAMESWGQCLMEWGYVSPRCIPPRMDVLMFSLAVGSITHCYADSQGQHRDVFRSKYLNVLDFIFGNSGLESGKVRHVPSTHDLLRSQGLDPVVLQRSASRLAASVQALEDNYEPGSPSSDTSSGPVTCFKPFREEQSKE